MGLILEVNLNGLCVGKTLKGGGQSSDLSFWRAPIGSKQEKTDHRIFQEEQYKQTLLTYMDTVRRMIGRCKELYTLEILSHASDLLLIVSWLLGLGT